MNENKETPSYFAILTADVRYSDKINANEKIMYAEITALSNLKGACWASNNYFASLYKCTPQAISKWIKNLESNGFITIEYLYKQGTKEIERRIIKCINNGLLGINKDLGGYQHTIKDNSININNTHISEKNTCVSADQDLNKYFEELHNGKYKPDNVDRNHNAFTFENKELNEELNINWEALVAQFNDITKKKAKAVLPRAKRQIIHLITNGYTKSDLVKVFTLASRDDWFKNNSNALNIDYLTREEVFTKYADI